ncbi:MAG: hypothetical protein IJX55_09060 [Clostridia bacterium]|nr:hypothetical protein [Clostridia bacterium]
MKKTITFLVCLFLLFSVFGVTAFASAVDTNFETLEVSQGDMYRAWDNIDFRKAGILNDSASKGAIRTFDVSESGKIILCLDDNRIAILDENGNVLRYFMYDSSGSSMACWKEENILLYLVRSDLLVEITIDGELVGMEEVDIHNVENNELLRDWEGTRKIEANGYTYKIGNDILILKIFSFESYSKLVRVDADGNIKTIYDAPNTEIFKILILILVALAFFLINLFMVIVVVKGFIKAQNEEKNKRNQLK